MKLIILVIYMGMFDYCASVSMLQYEYRHCVNVMIVYWGYDPYLVHMLTSTGIDTLW